MYWGFGARCAMAVILYMYRENQISFSHTSYKIFRQHVKTNQIVEQCKKYKYHHGDTYLLSFQIFFLAPWFVGYLFFSETGILAHPAVISFSVWSMLCYNISDFFFWTIFCRTDQILCRKTYRRSRKEILIYRGTIEPF